MDKLTLSPSKFFGWDILYKGIESDLKRESDVLIALVHWYLVKHFPMRCLGVGETHNIEPGEGEGDETLPRNWNENQSYSLRYRMQGEGYILLGTLAMDSLVINLVHGSSSEVSNVSFNLKKTVKSLKGKLQDLFFDHPNVLTRIQKELTHPILSTEKKSVTTQTVNISESGSPVHEPTPINLEPRRERDFHDYTYDPLRNIGRGDLDPLGRLGGGMLFQPPGFNSPDLNPRPMPGGPSGIGGIRPRIPPGARFDPFGPPGPNNRMGPDHDHFRPPGSNFDDMFM